MIYVLGDTTVLATMESVASQAVEAVESAAYAGVTLLVAGEMRTAVFTHPDALDIDQAQFDSGEGPCVDALRTGEILRITSTTADGPWPAFRQACRSRGIMSTASFPVTFDDVRRGTLNVYSHDHHAFGAAEIRLGRTLAAQVGMVIADAWSQRSARQMSDHLEEVAANGAEIEQAMGSRSAR